MGIKTDLATGNMYNIVRGVVIMLFIMSLAQNVIYWYKYEEALESLLVCTTAKYGVIDEHTKEIASHSQLAKTLENGVQDKDSAGSELLKDLTKKAQDVGIDKEKLIQDIKESGFDSDKNKVKKEVK